MIKFAFIVGILLFVNQSSQAQTWSEWFRQKKTQKKYLLQQIAALQVYLGYAKKGYEIADKGINTVRHIKDGDFNLHRDFFNSLAEINPAIRKYAKVAEIIAYQMRIVKATKAALQGAGQSQQFTPKELEHCKSVFDFLLADCLETIDVLIHLITSGDYEMKDDERIKRIDALYADMQSKFAFSSSYINELHLLSVQRSRAQTEINISRAINGIK